MARRERIDIIHAHWIIPQGIAGAVLRLLLPRIRMVVTAHGGDAYAFNGRAGRMTKKFVLGRADAVTAVSSQLCNDIQRDLAPARAPVVAPMGIDLARFGVAPVPRQRRFCFVGRLVEKKGVTDLLQAYARARALARDDRFPSLLLVGDGPLRNETMATIRQLGVGEAVTLTGWIDPLQVPAIMAGSLAVVVPSVVARDGDREGLGLVAVE
ncbi:MAG: glycosyltransferase, partial [Gammaproteobacteria bacterium]